MWAPKTGANIIGLYEENGEYIINPPAETILKERQKLILLGSADQIQAFQTMMTH